jgi:N-glycosylase/DNA lyase
MNETSKELLKQVDVYIEENTKFVEKGIKASAGRARKALNEIRKLAATRRKEITEEKNALSAKKE